MALSTAPAGDEALWSFSPMLSCPPAPYAGRHCHQRGVCNLPGRHLRAVPGSAQTPPTAGRGKTMPYAPSSGSALSRVVHPPPSKNSVGAVGFVQKHLKSKAPSGPHSAAWPGRLLFAELGK